MIEGLLAGVLGNILKEVIANVFATRRRRLDKKAVERVIIEQLAKHEVSVPTTVVVKQIYSVMRESGLIDPNEETLTLPLNEPETTIYERVASVTARDPGYLHLEGDLLQATKRYDEALTAYDQALALAPNDPTIIESKYATLRKRERDAAMASAAPPGVPVMLLDRYRVEDVLGIGGFGKVVRARDTFFPRTVAIKTLRRDLAASKPELFEVLQTRLRREAEAGGRMGVHRNIVTYYDLASDSEDTLYLIMEHIAGRTLWHRLQPVQNAPQIPLPTTEALRITADVARGLHAAHLQGVVHRDVKPANIFLAAEGQAKIGDFGIAQVDRQTVAGQNPQTPSYASPEQGRKELFLLPATDQYSLGAVLFEMITGMLFKGLFPADRERLLAKMPERVAALIRKMTAEQPSARYRDLMRVIAVITATGLTAPERLPDSDDDGDAEAGEGDNPPSVTTQPTGPWTLVKGLLAEAVRDAPADAVLMLEPRDYPVSGRIVINKPLTIIGAGWDATTIMGGDATGLIVCQSDGQVSLEGFSARYTGSGSGHVVACSRGKIALSRCHLSGGGAARTSTEPVGHGLLVSGAARATVQACEFVANGGPGIGVVDRAYALLEENICRANKWYGIAYFDGATGRVWKNVCEGNEGSGLGVGGQAQPTVEENTCRVNKSTGIVCDGSATGRVWKNLCEGNEGDGIYVAPKARPVLVSNVCTGNRGKSVNDQRSG